MPVLGSNPCGPIRAAYPPPALSARKPGRPQRRESPGGAPGRGLESSPFPPPATLPRGPTMTHTPDRREFLRAGLSAAAGLTLAALADARPKKKGPLFRISLAEWSLHRALFDGKL